MENRPKILIGIPSIRDNGDFKSSLEFFLKEMRKSYTVDCYKVNNFKIDVAREMIVEHFLLGGWTHLLFLDDDHSGHTVEMFEDLLTPDRYVVAMKCYRKEFPYLCTLMDYSQIDHPSVKFEEKNLRGGYAYCDLVGFGMTLIKRNLFDLLPKPYFVSDENNQKEDNYFCKQMEKFGLKPMGYFGKVLTHNGIDDTNRDRLFEEEESKLMNRIKDQFPGYTVKEIGLFV